MVKLQGQDAFRGIFGVEMGRLGPRGFSWQGLTNPKIEPQNKKIFQGNYHYDTLVKQKQEQLSENGSEGYPYEDESGSNPGKLKNKKKWVRSEIFKSKFDFA